MLDLDHFGLIAAANTLGLSSPSMGRFLASVKEQVAKEQAEIKKKQAVDKVRHHDGRSLCPASCSSPISPSATVPVARAQPCLPLIRAHSMLCFLFAEKHAGIRGP